MPERIRARYGEHVVTILEGKIGGRGKTKIRNAFGFEEEVAANKLEHIPKTEPEARLKFASPDD